jgi:hypothetical protein
VHFGNQSGPEKYPWICGEVGALTFLSRFFQKLNSSRLIQLPAGGHHGSDAQLRFQNLGG